MKHQTIFMSSDFEATEIELLNSSLFHLLQDYNLIVKILHKHYDFDNVLINSTSQSFKDILNNLKSLIDQI